jgi:hypothetical protein
MATTNKISKVLSRNFKKNFTGCANFHHTEMRIKFFAHGK